MFRKSTIAVAAAALAALGVIAPGSAAAATDAAFGAGSEVASAGAAGAAKSERLAAGELNYALDGFQCTNSGGLNGRGFIGSRGYMEELGATNVTSMKLTIVTQAKYTTAPFWRNVAGSAKTYSYSFGGDANSASHSLLGPAGSNLWAYSYTLNDDANNYIYRQSLKFVWSNPTSVVRRTINTNSCFSN